MSTADFSQYVDPAKVPRLSKSDARMSLTDYPPFLDRLLGVWGPLSTQEFHGLTTDGHRIEGLFSTEPDGAPVEAAAKAAAHWLAALDSSIRDKVSFSLDSDLWRHWQNTPLILRDSQVELLELPMPQRELALEIVQASLSSSGHQRVRDVMSNNLFLGRLIDLTELLNEWSFTMSIFGTPSVEQPWGWQLFGHHLALNCIFVGRRMVLSPVFIGLEPDHGHGEESRRLFRPHEERALRLMRSLGDAERSRAALYGSMLTSEQQPGRYHPDDGRQVGGAFQDNRIVPHEGVPVGSLGLRARRNLLSLAELFVENLPGGPAEARMREIERYLEQTHFAWIGPVDEVSPFYFRIHSPVVLFEFDHHSGIFLANEEPARFHVHTIVRSPNGGDYGKDLLQQHYSSSAHDRAVPGRQAGHDHAHDDHRRHGAHSHDGGKTFHRHD
ncbi:DUF3500 domain-containing protein (plasmid) [Paraburkholderia sprentiae WSM5005]|uniref:DUF3500 domain-containing protein n=1 Tax=Paraburkholderia sprentiae WSM5005 TaxID=754502 RepID=A0A1I9YWE7_9BURK|nr:DUF3500 domain-containing protein [Paraburkholderia sprentiae]APA90552.2 DUF3500 domain-containing protein [Paraburkholderia sprentiae WSM5005]